MIKRLYPDGKSRAFNVTYDDGVLQDVRFVELLDRYGVKGTFNLNAGLMQNGFEWRHESGLTVKRLSPEQARGLYRDHEVAGHTFTHPYLHGLDRAQILYELRADKEALETLFDRPVCGFAVPFDHYSPLIESCVRECGFEYGRISEESHSFTPEQDSFRWRAGLFHLSPQLEHFVNAFLSAKEELALCQIVGHTYDLDVYDLWDRMELIFRAVSAAPDVWMATHLELVRYLSAMRKAQITAKEIRNPSDRTLWFGVGEQITALEPGRTLRL